MKGEEDPKTGGSSSLLQNPQMMRTGLFTRDQKGANTEHGSIFVI